MLGHHGVAAALVENDPVATRGVAREGQPVFTTGMVHGDAQQPIRQSFPRAQTKALERLAALKMPAAADEGFEFLDGDGERLELRNLMLHCTIVPVAASITK